MAEADAAVRWYERLGFTMRCRTVAAFAGRLKDAVDLDSVRDDLAGIVNQALEPAHVSVWVSPRG